MQPSPQQLMRHWRAGISLQQQSTLRLLQQTRSALSPNSIIIPGWVLHSGQKKKMENPEREKYEHPSTCTARTCFLAISFVWAVLASRVHRVVGGTLMWEAARSRAHNHSKLELFWGVFFQALQEQKEPIARVQLPTRHKPRNLNPPPIHHTTRNPSISSNRCTLARTGPLASPHLADQRRDGGALSFYRVRLSFAPWPVYHNQL